MTGAGELLAAVRARTEGTPYAVTETDDGFDVGINIADATWYALLYQEHLSRTWIYHVKLVDEASKRLSISDDAYAVEWRAGVELDGGVPTPALSASLSRAQGRLETKSFQKTWAVNEKGHYDEVVDYHFTSSEGRDLIKGPAQELGWTEKMGLNERIGFIVGVGTIVLLVIAGVVIAIVALTVGL